MDNTSIKNRVENEIYHEVFEKNKELLSDREKYDLKYKKYREKELPKRLSKLERTIIK